MIFSYTWNFGMAFGLLLAEDPEEDGLAWGAALLLGPLTLIVEKPQQE